MTMQMRFKNIIFLYLKHIFEMLPTQKIFRYLPHVTKKTLSGILGFNVFIKHRSLLLFLQTISLF